MYKPSTFLRLLSRQVLDIKYTAVHRKLSSFLFVPRLKSDESQKIPSILSPQLQYLFHPDAVESIRNSISARQLRDVDLNAFSSQCQQIHKLRTELEHLEKLRADIGRSTQEHIKSGAKPEVVEEAIKEGRRLKDDYKSKWKNLIEQEETLIPRILELPNNLHCSVPLIECRVKMSHVQPPEFDYSPRSHVQIGSTYNYLKFSHINPGAYYLLGSLAALELATLDYFAVQFQKHDFSRISNPDICKTVVVEGSGVDVNNPWNSFQLENDSHDKSTANVALHHLPGSASLPSFCAFFTKHLVHGGPLPFKYFATGRNYRPLTVSDLPDLFHVKQSSQLQFFIPHRGGDDESLFEKTLDILQNCFRELDIHYRVVETSAAKLSKAERRRTEIQMWSPRSQTYHTVSAISDYGDFISKRLWMCYKEKDKHRFINIVAGNAITLPPFLACLVENCQLKNGDFRIPTVLQSYITRFY